MSDLLAASNGDNDEAACKYLLEPWRICSNARSDIQRACNSGIRQGRNFPRIPRQLTGEEGRTGEDGSGSMFTVTEGSDDDLIIVDHDEDEGYGDSGSDDDSSIYYSNRQRRVKGND